MNLEAVSLVAGIGGGIGVYAAALALGIRHGIDWDHIAAITDITSASASVTDEDESWLIGEPGVMLTDQSHHMQHGPHDGHAHPGGEAHTHAHGHDEHSTHPLPAAPVQSARVQAAAALQPERADSVAPVATSGAATATLAPRKPASGLTAVVMDLPKPHREAIWLGSLYAIGHGTVVVLLGMLAILAREFLPDWIDPVMERVVGVTLLLLAAYLFFSLYQYFRGGGEFRLRSRWMLVFAGVSNAWHWVRSRVGQHEHVHATPQQYSARTAYGIGLIHGIGAETGTQALIIATAVGATSQSVAVAALFVFVVGLLISNTFVTVASTVGFVSAKKRQTIYVVAGIIAATFSLVLGLVFISASTGILPDLDPYFRWIGGPET